jgi:hypothetical protein
VVAGFQTSPTQGLINLIGALVGFFFWILYVRFALEFPLAVFRMAEAASPKSTSGRDASASHRNPESVRNVHRDWSDARVIFCDGVCGEVGGAYFLRFASHTSRTGRLLGSIAMKAIPIPEFGRE